MSTSQSSGWWNSNVARNNSNLTNGRNKNIKIIKSIRNAKIVLIDYGGNKMLDIISIAIFIFLFLGFPMILIVIGGSKNKSKIEIEYEIEEQEKFLKDYQAKIDKRRRERKAFWKKLWKKILML